MTARLHRNRLYVGVVFTVLSPRQRQSGGIEYDPAARSSGRSQKRTISKLTTYVPPTHTHTPTPNIHACHITHAHSCCSPRGACEVAQRETLAFCQGFSQHCTSQICSRTLKPNHSQSEPGGAGTGLGRGSVNNSR